MANEEAREAVMAKVLEGIGWRSLAVEEMAVFILGAVDTSDVAGIRQAREASESECATVGEFNVHVQWKGTDACLDLRCPCGVVGHFDGYFAYAIECGACGRRFTLPSTMELLPWDADSPEPVVADRG